MRSTQKFNLDKLFVFALVLFSASVGRCQENEGNADLDTAFDLKIKAESTKDLDEVVKMCESAIEKGLDEEGLIQAKQLAASSLYEHADQLGRKIFATGGQDRRWRVFRSQALKRLKQATELQPDMVEAWLMIARLNMLPGGNLDAAKEAVKQAVDLAGEDREQLSSALFMRATLSDEEEAQLADLNQAIKVNPENMDAIRVRGAYYLSKGQSEEAMKDLNQWLESGTENTDDYINVVRTLIGMGDKFDDKLQDQALKIIDQAIAKDPENVNPLAIRAQLNAVREDLDAAAADATRALELEPQNIGILMLRASVYSDQQKLDEALADVNEVLDQVPAFPQAIEMRGIILSQQEKFAEAIEDIKALAEREPLNPSRQRQLAMLYNADDRPREAIKIYDKLLSTYSPDKWEGKSNTKKLIPMQQRFNALRGRGDAHLSTGEHQKAVEDYDEALTLLDEIREIEISEELDPSPPDDGVLNNLAWVLATSTFDDVRDGERAIKLATEAAEVTEFKQAHILSTLASGYAETGNFDSAIEWIEKAIEVNREAGESEPGQRNEEQKESLQKEYENYQQKKPWRELQDVEKEKKANEEKETEDSEKDSTDESEMKSDAPQKDQSDDNSEGEDEDDADEDDGDEDESEGGDDGDAEDDGDEDDEPGDDSKVAYMIGTRL